MRKAWDDIKSFVTVAMTIAFIIFTFLQYISGEQFYSLFQIVIAFYFGTQYEKKRGESMSTIVEQVEENGTTVGEEQEEKKENGGDE